MRRATPSVVNIFTSKEVRSPRHPLLNDPVFRRFFGDQLPAESQRAASLGSGVVVSSSGGVTTFDQLNHYLLYAEMQIPASNYWNVVHGGAPGEAAEDTEGLQTMRVLGQNMAWLMKLVAAGRGSVEAPARQPKTYMNFIR